MRRMLFLSMVVILGTMVLLTFLQAQEKKIEPVKTRVEPGTIVVNVKTDLSVDVIHANQCKCDLSDVDTFYMSNIMVDVSNHKVGALGVATESVLTVTYFDMGQGRMVTVTKNLTVLHPYPDNPWVFQKYVVVSTPVLVKKSIGITAVIRPKEARITDPVPANNTKTTHQCEVMIY